MKKVWKVARWELMKNIKNKQFIISTLLAPLLIIIFGALPTLLAGLGGEEMREVLVVDELGLFERVQEELSRDRYHLTAIPKEDLEEARKQVEEGEAYGLLHLEMGLLQENRVLFQVFEEKLDQDNHLRQAIDAAVIPLRLEQEEVSHEVFQSIIQPISFQRQILGQEEEGMAGFIVAIVFAGMLIYSLMFSGSLIFQGVIEEKKNRVVEVVLSSISPREMMMGKIIGYCVLGLLQLLFWILVGFSFAYQFFNVPVLDFYAGEKLPLFMLYFLMGYLLYSCFFAALGATMEDLQSASNFQGFLFVLPIMPIFFIVAILENPNGLLSRIVSFFPLTGPGVMMMRLPLTRVPVMDIVISILLIGGSILLVSNLATRIFHVGILMYGKNASIKEIWRWIHQERS